MAESTSTKGFFQSGLGLAVSAAVLFGTVWLIGKAWKTGTK